MCHEAAPGAGSSLPISAHQSDKHLINARPYYTQWVFMFVCKLSWLCSSLCFTFFTSCSSAPRCCCNVCDIKWTKWELQLRHPSILQHYCCNAKYKCNYCKSYTVSLLTCQLTPELWTYCFLFPLLQVFNKIIIGVRAYYPELQAKESVRLNTFNQLMPC